MSKKILLIIGSFLVVNLVQAANWPPFFEAQYIKMGAPGLGDRCGAVTVIPLRGSIQVRSVFWSGFNKKHEGLSDWVELPPEGLRVRYDWAGRHPDSHYKIYCRAVHLGVPQGIDCSEVVELDDIMHNIICGNWPRVIGGTGAPYEPLNMNKG